MSSYNDIRKTVHSSLGKFKDTINRYKTSISLGEKLKIIIKVDSEILINETFWEGGARNFNDGNISRVYNALKESFEENTNRLKASPVKNAPFTPKIKKCTKG